MERRQDDVRIDVLVERINNFIDGRYADDQKHSEEWRNKFCQKLDKAMDKIDKLPCPQRIEQTKGIKTQLKALWACVSAILLGIIAEWVKQK